MSRALLLLLVIVAGCSLPTGGTREPQRYFVLELPKPNPPAGARVNVSVEPTTAASFYDTQSIVFSRAPGTRAYYQFNSWTEPPRRAIHAALVARFERPDEKAALLLRTHLEEMYHDAVNAPGSARVTLSAEVRSKEGFVARRAFTRSAPAPSYDAPGAVKAFSVALHGILEELAGWLEQVAKGQT